MCVGLTVITINISLLNVGLPTLARQLGASNTGLEWIVDGYALVFAGFLLVAGSFGDRFGRRKVMMVGLAVFGLASLEAAFSQSTGQLIAARCVMGFGAAFVMPMTLSILTDVYPTEVGYRRAIGIWAATASAGSVAAPILSGVLLSNFWWGSLFLVNVPTSALTLVAVGLTVPESAPRRGASVDWLGGGLSIVMSAGLVFALIEGPDRGWRQPLVAGSLLVTAAAALLFVLVELRSSHPLVDLRCFRIPQFSVGCGLVAMQYFLGFGTSFVTTQYVQLVLGFSALATGFALMPSAAVVMFVAPYGARAFGRYGARAVTTVAMLIATIGAASMTFAGVDSTIVVIVVSMMLLSSATGLMAPGTTSMVMSAVPPEEAGMASGTQSTTRQLGGAIGVAVIGSVLASRYASSLTARVTGGSAATYLPESRRSLAAALSATPPGSLVHAALVHASRAAFVDGMHLAALVAAGAAALCALFAFVALRGAPARERARQPGAATRPAPVEDP
jgi:EmrB/QacA subfamily drug resistance transporter